jgi:hypothetical protein
VAYFPMLDSTPSMESCSSSLSSDSSESESIMASPPPVPDMVISVKLPDISDTPDVEVAQQIMPVEVETRVGSPVGVFS